MSALVCLHGHFYQPAREHPWLDTVEPDESAAPARDWNARITAECYGPNAAARILDAEGRVRRIVNNYATLSFDLGPALARWLEAHAPAVYAAIVDADHTSRAARGFGNALAHPYVHAILPLASPRDRRTLVRWGIADFLRRFGRAPDGMWLPETAADRATLAVLAECGLRFTILAPHQAARVRALPDGAWVDVRPEVLDTTRAYLCRPAPGRALAVFFYDAGIAHGIAFGPLLHTGEALAERLLAAAEGELGPGRLVHAATDGETFGHHHTFGEMALAYAARLVEERAGAGFTNYAAFLAAHPPSHEVEIHDGTSWSCAHGIERWRADCGCRLAPDTHQRWRRPLRQALDWLKAQADALFEDAGGLLFFDAWAARDAYVEVLLDRHPATIARFMAAHLRPPAAPGRRRDALALLEAQRHALLMFASDGWFFDELSRPEPVQLLRHAARVLQLAERFGRSLEAPFLEYLRAAETNVPAYADGVAVYERLVRPAVADLRRLAAHTAILQVFEDVPEEAAVYGYPMRRTATRRVSSGTRTLLTGRLQATDRWTEDAETFSYAVLHVGGIDVHACLGPAWDDAALEGVTTALAAALEGGTVADVIRLMDRTFGDACYTLRDLFVEERRRVLTALSATAFEALDASLQRLYREHRPLMEVGRRAGMPVPMAFIATATLALVTELQRALQAPEPLPRRVLDAVAEARAWGIALRVETLGPLLEARLLRQLEAAAGGHLEVHLADVLRTLDVAREAGIAPDLWRAQALFYARLVPQREQATPAARAALAAVADRLNLSPEVWQPAPTN